jgi:hypothetical protein
MTIWFAMLIPVIAALIGLRFFNRSIVWWEYLIPFGVSAIMCVTSKSLIEYAMTYDTEYWGSAVKYARYYEDWNEYIHRTCTRSCGKNCTEEYDCSYVDYHPAYWEVITTTGEEISISESQYNKLVSKFHASPMFVELNRPYYSNDGDMYFVEWGGTDTDLEPVTTSHSYTNKIQSSSSVFNLREVSTDVISKYKLFQYPPITGFYDQQLTLGCSDKECECEIQKLNATLGSKKQVRVYVLIFEGMSREAGLWQRDLWGGGNKNEFVVCIGKTGDHVNWCEPFTWSKSDNLTIATRDYVESMKKYNGKALVSFLRSGIESKWERRNFKDFDYLTVDPPTWAVVLTYILTIIANFLTITWAINNEYENR